MGARDDFEVSRLLSLENSSFIGLLTLEKYSEITGVPLQVCLGHVNKGLIPCITIGRRRLINIVAIQRELAKKPFVFRG